MKQKPDWNLCEICHKPRGRGRDHSACSKQLRDLHAGDMKVKPRKPDHYQDRRVLRFWSGFD